MFYEFKEASMSARRAIGWAVGLLLTISFSTSGNVLAQTPLTPAAGADAGQPGTTVHEPSAPPLYDQTAHVGSNWSDSSDYGKSHGQLYGYLSNQAADDFVVPSSVFWKVVTATVDGQYVGVQGAGVDHLWCRSIPTPAATCRATSSTATPLPLPASLTLLPAPM